MYFIIIIFVAAGIILSLYYLVSQDDHFGVIVFLIVLPLLQLLEWDFKGSIITRMSLGPIVMTPSLLWISALFFLVAIKKIKNAQSIDLSPLFRYIFFFSFFLLIGNLLSEDPAISFRRFSIEVLYFPLLFFIIVNVIQNKDQLFPLFAAFTAYFALRLLILFYFYWRYYGFEFAKFKTLYGPDLLIIATQIEILCTLALITIPLLVTLFILLRKAHSYSFFFPVVISFSFLILLLSEKRAVQMALIITALFFMPFFKGINKKMLYLTGAAAALFLVSFLIFKNPEVFTKWGSWITMDDFYADQYQRIDAYKNAVKIMIDHPLGIGFNTFEKYAPSYSTMIILQPQLVKFGMGGVLGSVHSFFLNYGVVGGIGCILSLMIFIFFLYRFAYTACSSHGVEEKLFNLSVGLLWCLSAYLLASTFESVLGFTVSHHHIARLGNEAVVDVGIFFWMTAGLIISLYRFTVS